MTSRYVPFRLEQIEEYLRGMGFRPIDVSNSWEWVYERDVVTATGVEHPYTIRIYSSVDRRTGITRECGADAIRLVLFDKMTNRPVQKASSRVFRTKSAFGNIRLRARELFRRVLDGPHCPCCGSIMVERKGGPPRRPFWGCSHYAPGRTHHCTGTREVERDAA